MGTVASHCVNARKSVSNHLPSRRPRRVLWTGGTSPVLRVVCHQDHVEDANKLVEFLCSSKKLTKEPTLTEARIADKRNLIEKFKHSQELIERLKHQVWEWYMFRESSPLYGFPSPHEIVNVLVVVVPTVDEGTLALIQNVLGEGFRGEWVEKPPVIVASMNGTDASSELSTTLSSMNVEFIVSCKNKSSVHHLLEKAEEVLRTVPNIGGYWVSHKNPSEYKGFIHEGAPADVEGPFLLAPASGNGAQHSFRFNEDLKFHTVLLPHQDNDEIILGEWSRDHSGEYKDGLIHWASGEVWQRSRSSALRTESSVEWVDAHALKNCLTIDDIRDLKFNDKIDICVLNDDWQKTCHSNNTPGTALPPTTFFRCQKAQYTHKKKLEGVISFDWGEMMDFEFFVEQKGVFVELGRDGCPTSEELLASGSKARVGFKGPLLKWEALEDLPKLAWIPKDETCDDIYYQHDAESNPDE